MPSVDASIRCSFAGESEFEGPRVATDGVAFDEPKCELETCRVSGPIGASEFEEKRAGELPFEVPISEHASWGPAVVTGTRIEASTALLGASIVGSSTVGYLIRTAARISAREFSISSISVLTSSRTRATTALTNLDVETLDMAPGASDGALVCER